MMAAADANPPAPKSRLDLFRIGIGTDGQNQKFEVLGVYLHTLAYCLPAAVIRTIVKDEFVPEDLRLLFSRRFGCGVEALNAQLLRRCQEAVLSPLRSEKYGRPPWPVWWHFFAAQTANALMEMLRKLPPA